MLNTIFIVALAASFFILTITKMGIRECLMKVSNPFFYKLLDCDFCLGFWVSCFISLFLFIIFGDAEVLVIPFFTAPLIRFLL